MVFAVLVDELNVAGNNRLVNARPFFDGRTSDWAAYLNSPISVGPDASNRILPECTL
jgi:hypothetical protein